MGRSTALDGQAVPAGMRRVVASPPPPSPRVLDALCAAVHTSRALPRPQAPVSSREGAPPPAMVLHPTLLAVQVAFASLAVAGKVVTRTLEPSALALIRLAGAGLVLGALLARRGIGKPIPRRDLLGIAGCATLGIYLNQVLFLYGLRLTSPVNATVLIATIPVFAVLAAMLLRIEPPRARTLGGVAIALAGVLFLIGSDLELGGDTVVGDLLVVANSLVYALYLVLVRTYVARHGSITVVAIGFAFATLLALPCGAPVLIAQAPAIEARIWWLALYVVLVPTVFTYLANAWALRFASSSVVAIYIYVQPPVAALLTWVFLGELPSPRVYVTIAAVFAGIWLVTRPPAGSRS